MPRTTRTSTPAKDPLFFHRDISWLKFNERVLEEAEDTTNPLLERLRFLSITASNLDEFVEIRVAGVLQRMEEGPIAGGTHSDEEISEEQHLKVLAGELHSFLEMQSDCWRKQILPALKREKIFVCDWPDLTDAERDFCVDFYNREVDPLLTPVIIDPSHPFPRVLNKALCIALLLRRKGRKASKTVLGIVTVPRSLPRFVRLPSAEGEAKFAYLSELLEARAERMFAGYEILAHSPFRITRNSNLYLQEEEARSLLESVRSELHNRRKGDVVRLEVDCDADASMVEQLRDKFELDEWQVFRTDSPVNLTRIADLYGQVQRADLKFQPFQAKEHQLDRRSANMFAELQHHDILLHHPFESFSTVENFLRAGDLDERVVTVKQTLYRTNQNAPIFQALVEAASSKDVTVVVELKARFDEDSNIRWARSLEDAGVQVFHGVVGLKTHCKLALIVRRDEDGIIRRYAHLGTGNYNSVTARFYTDISLLTCNPEITAAVHRVFNYLTASSVSEEMKPLLVAPLTLSDGLLELIGREAEHARAGKPAHIVAKMNGLLEPGVIRALYDASQAGVKIDLIIRGMCALRPGVPGLSENITVRSVVGRFLEHSRIFCFANGGNEQIFCGSADWMTRNIFERCEVVFPVTDPALMKRLRYEIVEAYLRDTRKTRLLQPDGSYTRISNDGTGFSAQDFLMAGGGELPEASLPKHDAEAAPAAKAVKTTKKKAALPKEDGQ